MNTFSLRRSTNLWKNVALLRTKHETLCTQKLHPDTLELVIEHPFHILQVYIDSPIILNGLCLRWKGYINLEKLDGVGGMKFDEDSARVSNSSDHK